MCKPTAFRLNLPVDEDDPQGPKTNRRVLTTGCRRDAKFLVPLLPDAYFQQVDHLAGSEIASYDREGDRSVRMTHPDDFDFDDDANKRAVMGDGSPALAKVCAVDDAMGLWPRFQGVMHTGESFQE